MAICLRARSLSVAQMSRVVERRNRYIDRIRIFGLLEKQMRAATCGKRANPIRIRDFARLTLCHVQIVAVHGAPCDVGRAGASPAIDAMTIAEGKRPTFQQVTCSTANASASELHIFLKLLSLLPTAWLRGENGNFSIPLQPATTANPARISVFGVQCRE